MIAAEKPSSDHRIVSGDDVKLMLGDLMIQVRALEKQVAELQRQNQELVVRLQARPPESGE